MILNSITRYTSKTIYIYTCFVEILIDRIEHIFNFNFKVEKTLITSTDSSFMNSKTIWYVQ
jgi:hypothetical protein